MRRVFADIMFTPSVQDRQTRHGSREAYAKFMAGTAREPVGLTPHEADFIATRDTFYMASVTEAGWPYVQHRGGPAGFLRTLDEKTLGFADYRGNKQYVSMGNFDRDDRVALILMDYPRRQRLKLLARAEVVDDLESHGERLAPILAGNDGNKIERVVLLHVVAFDWNCPQYITPRYTEAELSDLFGTASAELEKLRAENAALKSQLKSCEQKLAE